MAARLSRRWPAGIVAACLLGFTPASAAELQAQAARTRAELNCAPTATALVYDCTVRLWRGDRPLAGVEIVAGAEMPSMPMAHAVRPSTATPGQVPGEYRLRLALEMLGEWAVTLRLRGPVRDLLVLHYRFDHQGASPARR